MSQHQDIATADLITYYENLLIIQYIDKPKANATIGALVGQIIANQIIDQVSQGFNILTAFGIQLDLLAAFVGVMRNVFGLNLNRQYFSMPRYGDLDAGTVLGFPTYATVFPFGPGSVYWFWLTYLALINPVYGLTDDELRKVIQYKAALRSSNLSLASLDAIFFQFFGTFVTIIDNGNMSVTYQHSSADLSNLFGIIQEIGILPHPAGCAINVTTI